MIITHSTWLFGARFKLEGLSTFCHSLTSSSFCRLRMISRSIYFEAAILSHTVVLTIDGNKAFHLFYCFVRLQGLEGLNSYLFLISGGFVSSLFAVVLLKFMLLYE